MSELKLFEFNDELRLGSILPAYDFQCMKEMFEEEGTSEQVDRVLEMYAARRQYSGGELRAIPRMSIKWRCGGCTPLRKQGETRDEWLAFIASYGGRPLEKELEPEAA